MHISTIDDVRQAANVMAQHLSPVPLVRSHALEKELGLPEHRRVWIKDYGWTPVGSSASSCLGSPPPSRARTS